MGDKDKLILDEPVEEGVKTYSKKHGKKHKGYLQVPWYFAGGIVLFWGLLFVGVVKPLFYRLPEPLTVEDASKGVFIAERARANLYDFQAIGTKVVGSDGNEHKTVEFLLKELNLIKDNIQEDLFDMEIDLQHAYGAYVKWNLVNMYQGIQNVVVKLTPKASTSENYILVNSHFDSQPTSPSTGDDGHMVVSILEVLRVISSSRVPFEHPIIFLINGSEENSLQASHGFIAYHKWAKNCKAVINLDAAGSGGRELMFQSGPNYPWLVKIYKEGAKHYFSTTMAEEIFQTGLVPSYTDFDIFVEYGNLIGLDIGQCINGFVYHTKYDRIDVIPTAALQNTGDNLLGLVRTLSNATELRDISANPTGNTIFFDVLGLYLISYSADVGVKLNYAVAAATIILIYLSVLRIAEKSNVDSEQIQSNFILVLVVQIIAFVLAVALPLLVAYGLDKYGLSLSYFATPSLLVGLYVCPSLLGLTLPSYIYLKLKNTDKVSFAQQVQLILHGHAAVVAILCIAINYYGLRTTYVITWTLVFYVIPLAFNLITTLHDRGYSWTGILKVIQVAPFMYNSYLFYCFIVILTPMMGRFGVDTNPDLYIGGLTALGAILSMGFLILLVNMSRRSGLVLFGLLAVAAASVYIASSTDIGFPYRPKTNVQRVPYLQVRRVFYEYDGTVSKDESGYLFNFQDRRGVTPLLESNVDLTGLVNMTSDCAKYMMCGMPLYDHRWVEAMEYTMWLPRKNPVWTPAEPILTLLNKTIQADSNTVRFEFELQSPDHTSIFIQPYEDVTVSSWSFLAEYLTTNSPPYHIYYSFGIDDTPLRFYIELKKLNRDFTVPLFQLGVSAQYMHVDGDEEAIRMAKSIPDYAVSIQWPAMYKKYIF
ncbi:endoplasmic reticulum metallopeptidase 1 isoform X1 [Drosophila teissieri]|uniref:endoplasmic reticulum metallopeptidase 1 isoform X1 n=1 Tax=Drosophila teissieri TaxID=7243 RepID=UPI001CBA42FB|nr:endoplasmic reticulum metallopeptidase 1 isoform X1 [Drosophila teissieri]